jgi:DNA-binding XRE family transcriptional regulator
MRRKRDSQAALAKLQSSPAFTSSAAVVRKPGILVDQKVRKSGAAGMVRKPDVSLERKVGKTDTRSQVRKSDAHLVDARKAVIGPVAAPPPGKADIERTIALNVHRLRRSVKRSTHWNASHFTQQELADALDVNRQAVIQIEAGRRKISAAELVLVARFFHVPITELLL